jgi:hypothetical protein
MFKKKKKLKLKIEAREGTTSSGHSLSALQCLPEPSRSPTMPRQDRLAWPPLWSLTPIVFFIIILENTSIFCFSEALQKIFPMDFSFLFFKSSPNNFTKGIFFC